MKLNMYSIFFIEKYLKQKNFNLLSNYFILPLRGRHQSSIYPDKGEEWQERTIFVIFIKIKTKSHF